MMRTGRTLSRRSRMMMPRWSRMMMSRRSRMMMSRRSRMMMVIIRRIIRTRCRRRIINSAVHIICGIPIIYIIIIAVIINITAAQTQTRYTEPNSSHFFLSTITADDMVCFSAMPADNDWCWHPMLLADTFPYTAVHHTA